MTKQVQINEKNFTEEERRQIEYLISHRYFTSVVENALRLELQKPSMATVQEAYVNSRC